MSRIKRFAHSLLSGYLQLGVNVLFTLASLPLALNYLGQEEFGLWALTTGIAGYIVLIDFGLNAAAARIIIDYKDHPQRGQYGAIIQTDALVGLSQGVMVFVLGAALSVALRPLLNIPATLQGQYLWLMIGQSALLGIMFATRVVTHILVAHQRFDVVNYGSALSLAVNYAILYWGFVHGWGVYSMLWGQAAAYVSVLIVSGTACHKLGLFPRRGEWGQPTWSKFHELFGFGRDVFLFTLGNQFVNASQTLLLTRLIGLDAAATWIVCTRAYAVLTQVIGRIFDFSTSALAEMIVHNERERLLRRFREIAVVSVNLAVAAGTLFAIANGPFVKVWTRGKIGWPARNDSLLAVWLVICIAVRLHTGLVGQAKAFRFMRYLYFLEGLTFVGFTLLLERFGGITIMLVISIVCSLCFTFPYGLWRTREYFHLTWGGLARWHWGTFAIACGAAPAALLVFWATRNLSALERLIVELAVAGPWLGFLFLRYGLGASSWAEVSRFVPGWARPILVRVACKGVMTQS